MKKTGKIATSLIFGAVIASSLASCGKQSLKFWTGFGSDYSSALETMIEQYESETGVSFTHQGQGGYDNLQINIGNSVSTMSYPNIANGYADHFVGYISSEIQLPLDDYIEAYNEKNNTDLLADFYPQYLEEVQKLAYKEDGTPYTYGLPFNKSTEVMVYNETFVDYVKSLDNTADVPATWQDWLVQGPKFMSAMDGLYENRLIGNGTSYQVLTNKDAPIPEGFELKLDFTNVKSIANGGSFRLFSWDALDNLFITLVRQFGGIYTVFTEEDYSKYGHGWATFADQLNRPFTIEALKMIKYLHDLGYFGTVSEVGGQTYASKAFIANNIMFNVCSSGGLSNNIGKFPVGIKPIYYYDDGEIVNKSVISQGTNLAIFDQGSAEDKQKCFDAIVKFSTGQYQADWAVTTGYYPSCISAQESETYKKLLNTTQTNPIKKIYQESAVLNSSVYMGDDTGWVKFVDPSFKGSSKIRTEVETLIPSVIVNAPNEVTKEPGTKTYDQILDDLCARISTYIKK